ncbi:putative Transposon TX1 [Gossypium australe]|uniref:Putative Transposon TX1 n=1 Tax=Gossypium australe TaxID=47621 RepID=A0A5B6WIV4_9ROSI|nr:putative Transposon TX1 [Gossypium australe]
MKFSGSNSLAQHELEVKEEIDNIMHHEEMLWQQKSRYEWLKLGDRNTKITTLCNSNREWIFEPGAFKAEVVNFFHKLYGEVPGPFGSLP